MKTIRSLNPAIRKFPITVGLLIPLAAWLLTGCAAPIGADLHSTRDAYQQVDANALRTGKPSGTTESLLHRYDLDTLAERHPDEAVRQLHQQVLTTGDRNLLFALSEMSYVAGNQIRRSLKPWDPRDERDFYLGSAVYAWLFLFGEGKDAVPGPYDRRFREACDFYNYSLGLAFTERRSTNAVVHLKGGRRRLPVGEIELSIKDTPLAMRSEEFEEVLLADRFRVRGLSVRNRDAGVGAPMICVGHMISELKLRRSMPATAFLRLPASLAEIQGGNGKGSLELYDSDVDSVAIGGARVPLETDLTAYRAYNLNQSTIWKLGPLQFLQPGSHVGSQLFLNQPYDPERIPVVFVHGTFSSPVTWAEMANTLTADPVLRERYQFWSFFYGSGNPLVQSIADFRKELTAEVQQVDPLGTNVPLRQMVVIGHSQGGLVTKGAAVETGDRIWRIVSTNDWDSLAMSDAEREDISRKVFLKPLPYVSRVVFIATPHRGSYLAGSFARRLAARFVALPSSIATRTKDSMRFMTGSDAGDFFRGRIPTSLDSMSPKNPGLLAMAEVPVLPPIKANSIIAIDGEGDYHKGRDGLVSYESAHVNYAESEFIVRSFHTCLNEPSTIEEVRRILHEHLAHLPAVTIRTNGESLTR